MSELTGEALVCPKCETSFHCDDFPAHQRDCRGTKPKLPVSGWLVRLDAGRLRILTLGPTLLLGVTFVDADFSVTELVAALRYLEGEISGNIS